jgi:hypothetical protein
MADRDDKNLRHFVARAQQPKKLAAGNHGPTPPVQVNIVLDQGFGSVSDQIDDTRFRYMGTGAPISKYESMCGRRTQHACNNSVFEW